MLFIVVASFDTDCLRLHAHAPESSRLIEQAGGKIGGVHTELQSTQAWKRAGMRKSRIYKRPGETSPAELRSNIHSSQFGTVAELCTLRADEGENASKPVVHKSAKYTMRSIRRRRDSRRNLRKGPGCLVRI